MGIRQKSGLHVDFLECPGAAGPLLTVLGDMPSARGANRLLLTKTWVHGPADFMNLCLYCSVIPIKIAHYIDFVKNKVCLFNFNKAL